jgi:lysophospholipase L1-like esterase
MTYAKLDKLRQWPGIRVVVFGDSLVYGHTMGEHGVADWRAHTLSRQLERILQQSYPGQPVKVLNMGMNGAVPADLEQMARLSLATHPHLVVFDTALRSFSKDFAKGSEQFSRPWLQNLKISSGGRYVEEPAQDGLGSRIEAVLKSAAVNASATVELRDLIQGAVFDGKPREALRRIHSRTNSWLKGGVADSGNDPLNDPVLMLLLRSKHRYESINLDPENPECQALERTLVVLADAKQPTVLFYGKENPVLVRQVIAPERYRVLRDEFDAIVARHARDSFAYVPPIERLAPGHYLDIVHVNIDGYEIYADEIAKAGVKVLGLADRRSSSPSLLTK